MTGTLGKSLRMGRLFGEDGRMVSIMFDHVIARGLLPGLIPIEQKIGAAVNGRPDAISVQKGIADHCFAPHATKNISLILKASSPSPYDKGYAAILADVEEALTRGADAIAVGCILGGKEQARGMEHAAALTKEAAKWGMPVVGHFYPNGENVPADQRENWENVAYAARVGSEIGVDILKIHHSGDVEELSRIVEAVPAKIVLAAGNHSDKIRDYLTMAHHVVLAGGAGVAFGRTAWGYPDSASFIQAVRMIIHENASVDAAMEFLSETAGTHIE